MSDIKVLVGLPEIETWVDHILPLESIYPNQIFVQKLEDEDFINQFCDDHKITFILPTRYSQVRFLLEHNINRKYFCPPNYESIKVLNNKARFLKYFIDNDLTEWIPQTYVIKTNTINYNKTIIYPSIYKPCIGSLGSGIRVIKDSSDLEFYKNDNYIIQEYIKDNNEYVGNFIVNDGKIISSIILQETFNDDDDEFYYKNFSAKDYKIIDITNNVIEGFNIIFTKLNYTGMACADYKIINNKIVIFEINPRFGATIIKSELLYVMINKLIELTDESDKFM